GVGRPQTAFAKRTSLTRGTQAWRRQRAVALRGRDRAGLGTGAGDGKRSRRTQTAQAAAGGLRKRMERRRQLDHACRASIGWPLIRPLIILGFLGCSFLSAPGSALTEASRPTIQ